MSARTRRADRAQTEGQVVPPDAIEEGEQCVEHSTAVDDQNADAPAGAGQQRVRAPSGDPRSAAASLTVPPCETADLPVTVDPSVSLDYWLYGAIGARVVAAGNDGRTVLTPLGFYLEPQFRTASPSAKP